MSQNTIININGTNKSSIPWINVYGTWKKCIPWINVNGVWKQCYQSGTHTMTVYIPSSGNSSSQSQSRTISITGLQSVISCTVDTGSVSYTVNGTDVTINVSGGTSVGSSTPSKTGGATLGTTYPGAPASNLPDTYNYNYNGYSGTIPAVAAAYLYSGTDAGSKTGYASVVYTYTVTGVDTYTVSPTLSNTYSYSDSEGYTGTLNLADPAYDTAQSITVNNAVANGTVGSYPLTCYYEGTVTKPDTRIWRRDYSGTVYGTTTYYYAYVVTLNYTI